MPMAKDSMTVPGKVVTQVMMMLAIVFWLIC